VGETVAVRPFLKAMCAAAVAACLVATVAGCGSSTKRAQTPTTTSAHASTVAALTPLRLCLRRRGYGVTPISASALKTAPRRFEFVTVWDLVNPNRLALAVTISRSVEGARRAAVYTRKLNAKIGKGVVKAPVVQFGKINVLWTDTPDPPDKRNIYGCVRRHAQITIGS
jgi:hypothetical protein